ncbi:M91 family zinc metallopeptidase [Spongiimicrobium sp. 3-5]|uniref:M91 family zinc metallopeptidase n=1 Tax=Spongiimicrobium sp. 3-5 TaxID=3332596 RepID=UPI00397EE96B
MVFYIEYDDNGNMISDLNKGITDIDYNHLNKPTKITVSGANDGIIDYIYDAYGRKLSKVKTENGITKNTDYTGNYIYENGSLAFFSTPEGYVEPKDPNNLGLGYDYIYQYKDHLGNIRLSYKNVGTASVDLEIQEENNYYPFGLQHKGYNNVINGQENNYQTFQGQEEEKELGKNTYAFQWRDYDPAIARFNKIDRFAEKYYDQSPYNFTKNSPMVFTEVKGDSIWVNTGFRKLRYENGKLYNKKGKEVRKGLTNRIANGKSSGSFVGKAVGALNDIANAETNTGTDVISTLQSSDNNFVITNASKNPRGAGINEFKADDRSASYNIAILDSGQGTPKAGGSGGTVYWNPSGGSVLELGGGQGTRPTSNLAHELFHGYDANFGLTDNRPTSTGLKRMEGRASFFENQIRSQLGYPSREFYRTGGTNYRILDNNNKPIQVAPPSITWLNFIRL